MDNIYDNADNKKEFAKIVSRMIKKALKRKMDTTGEELEHMLLRTASRLSDSPDYFTKSIVHNNVVHLIDAMYILDRNYLKENHLSIFKHLTSIFIAQRDDNIIRKLLATIGEAEFKYIKDYDRGFRFVIKSLAGEYRFIEDPCDPDILSVITSFASPEVVRESKQVLMNSVFWGKGFYDNEKKIIFFTFQNKDLLKEFAVDYAAELLSLGTEINDFLFNVNFNTSHIFKERYGYKWVKSKNLYIATIIFFFFYYPYHQMYHKKLIFKVNGEELAPNLFHLIEKRIKERKMFIDSMFGIVSLLREITPNVVDIYLTIFLISALLIGDVITINKVFFLMLKMKKVNITRIQWVSLQYYYTYKSLFRYNVIKHFIESGIFIKFFFKKDYRTLLRIIIEKEEDKEVLRSLKEIIKKDKIFIRKVSALKMLEEAGI